MYKQLQCYQCNKTLFDVANSNIPNKNVLNTAEATAVINIPSKISRKMFFPTTYLQNVKDKYENNSHSKDPATNIHSTITTSGTGNVGYMRDKGLVFKNETVISCSENIAIMIRFCDYTFHMIWKSYMNLYAGEKV